MRHNYNTTRVTEQWHCQLRDLRDAIEILRACQSRIKRDWQGIGVVEPLVMEAIIKCQFNCEDRVLKARMRLQKQFDALLNEGKYESPGAGFLCEAVKDAIEARQATLRDTC